MQFGAWTNFEAGSLANTLIIIVLPLGTLVAQRLSSNPSQFNSAGLGGADPSSRSSGAPLRSGPGGLVSSWLSSARRQGSGVGGTSGNHGVVSRIETGGRYKAATMNEKMDPVDRELRSIDEDLEAGAAASTTGSGGIRVDRELSTREERA